MYRLAEGSPVAANTIGIEVVAFLTAGGLMSYRSSTLDLHSARSTNQIGFMSFDRPLTRMDRLGRQRIDHLGPPPR